MCVRTGEGRFSSWKSAAKCLHVLVVFAELHGGMSSVAPTQMITFRFLLQAEVNPETAFRLGLWDRTELVVKVAGLKQFFLKNLLSIDQKDL